MPEEKRWMSVMEDGAGEAGKEVTKEEFQQERPG